MLRRLWRFFDSVVSLEDKTNKSEAEAKALASGDNLESELSRSDCSDLVTSLYDVSGEVTQPCDVGLLSSKDIAIASTKRCTKKRVRPGTLSLIVDCCFIFCRRSCLSEDGFNPTDKNRDERLYITLFCKLNARFVSGVLNVWLR